MSTNRCLLLIILLGFIHAGCVPQNVNVNTQPTETENSDALTQEDNIVSAREKQREFLLKQDYQGALDLMPLLEKELLLEESQEMASRDARDMYCYLYMALGRDEEALPKIKEYEQSRVVILKDTNLMPEDLMAHPAVEEALFSILKTTIMSRLNMANEIAEEIDALLSDKNVGYVWFAEIPFFYASAMDSLATAQMVKGDYESARKNIVQCRDYMNERHDPVKGLSGPISFGLPKYFSWHESLNMAEYFINHLTETHFVRFVKGRVEPPEPDPEYPDQIQFSFPLVTYKFVSKVDGSLFTTDDFRNATAVPIVDPFPLLERNAPNENVETE